MTARNIIIVSGITLSAIGIAGAVVVTKRRGRPDEAPADETTSSEKSATEATATEDAAVAEQSVAEGAEAFLADDAAEVSASV